MHACDFNCQWELAYYYLVWPFTFLLGMGGGESSTDDLCTPHYQSDC